MSSKITVYSARRILTMNPANPEASHVAVREGRILGAGSLEELQGWGDYDLDETFADKVLMPGFVEGHSHTMEGTFWRYTYCGYFDRMDPDGEIWSGLQSLDAIVDRLAETAGQMPTGTEPVTGWGMDPIYYGERRCARGDLDRASSERPVGVLHASCHIMNVNTRALELAGLMREGIDHPGIPLGEDGFPTGELRGPDAIMLAGLHVGLDRNFLVCEENGVRQFARLCVRQGVTTATDLANVLPAEAVEMMLRVTGEEDYPTRIVALRVFRGVTPREAVDHALELREKTTERLRLGIIKVISDGSVQGFSARLRWPGYYNGKPNGLWYVSPEHLQEIYDLALENGVQIHTHNNGDEATQLVIETLERSLARFPRRDHRFTMQHCQLADRAQFRRMKELGLCVNLFPNHHYYWGDQHYATTVGPERARRMNACATALREGVPLAIHSDAPVTPLGPLFTAWCAINRKTPSGRVLGEEERIGLDDALRTITLGAAYTLKMDGEVGSIECGKRADFAVLEEDPYEVGEDGLKDIGIWGVVTGGKLFPAADI